MNIPVIIPAYQPSESLLTLIQTLVGLGIERLVIVNDGSRTSCRPIFEELRQIPQVTLAEHAINLGKGAALKTGINAALCSWPEIAGVVTADADSQHSPTDILAVAQHFEREPEALTLGVRGFQGSVPLRSRIGNAVTRWAFRLLVGKPISDTQTGLRGVPLSLLAVLLRTVTYGYEFELDMLIAAKHQGVKIVQVPISTIYMEQNQSSHFNPILDSMRIYWVLFRFTGVSVMTALLDNTIFALLFLSTAGLASSQAGARLIAMLFQYTATRRVVFHSTEKHTSTLPKYLGLVIFSSGLSYLLIRYLSVELHVNTLVAKLLAETALFLGNFAIQRDLVFTKSQSTSSKTDWTQYYTRVPFTARITRKYTSAVLLSSIRRFVGTEPSGLTVIELGGANSCFLGPLKKNLRIREYHVIDTNEYGLNLLRARCADDPAVVLHAADATDLPSLPQSDLVFSVGLIEHFGKEDTSRVIQAHFDPLRSGGIAIITYPTPTWLYRVTRRALEIAGLWRFPDERPLRSMEVKEAVGNKGQVLYEKILWPLVLTQQVIVLRK
jgi:putative flippase GtrA